MKRQPTHILAILLFTIGILFQAVGKDNHQTAMQMTRSHFGDSFTVQHESKKIPPQLMDMIQKQTGFRYHDETVDIYAVRKNEAVRGWSILDSVRSKSSFLPFLLITDSSLTVQALHLLNTPDRSSAKLQAPWWKKQFIGKKESQLKRIDAVSGATISSNDLAKAVRASLVYLQHTYNK